MYTDGQVRICFGYGTNGLIVQQKSENNLIERIKSLWRWIKSIFKRCQTKIWPIAPSFELNQLFLFAYNPSSCHPVDKQSPTSCHTMKFAKIRAFRWDLSIRNDVEWCEKSHCAISCWKKSRFHFLKIHERKQKNVSVDLSSTILTFFNSLTKHSKTRSLS
jgi:hypothetical protein